MLVPERDNVDDMVQGGKWCGNMYSEMKDIVMVSAVILQVAKVKYVIIKGEVTNE